VGPRVVHAAAIGVVVLGRAIRFPRVLVRTRTIDVPTIDPALDLEAVQVEGDRVALRVRHEGVRQRLHLDALRAAVRDGATKLGATIFG